ncbi:unnamed protein product [Diamesa hyperborea]
MQHVYYIELIRSHILMLKNELQKIVDQSNTAYLSTDKKCYELSLEKLQAIKKGYGQIWDITNNVNDMLTWSQAANFTHNFVQMACDMYWSYHILLNSSLEDSYATTILCSISPIPILSFVLFSAERATVEAVSISRVLHSIRKNIKEIHLYKMVNDNLNLIQ